MVRVTVDQTTAGRWQLGDMVDWPTAWVMVRETTSSKHHERCSYSSSDGAFMCDCAAWEFMVAMSNEHDFEVGMKATRRVNHGSTCAYRGGEECDCAVREVLEYMRVREPLVGREEISTAETMEMAVELAKELEKRFPGIGLTIEHDFVFGRMCAVVVWSRHVGSVHVNGTLHPLMVVRVPGHGVDEWTVKVSSGWYRIEGGHSPEWVTHRIKELTHWW